MSINTTGGDAAVITPTKHKRPSGRAILMATVALLLLGAGYGVGSANAAPAPAPVGITKTVEVPGPTKTVETEVTPASCLKALDVADQVFRESGDILGIIGEALGGERSLVKAPAAMDKHTAKIKELTPHYQSAKASCKEAA